ncbi:MAG: hypothetical protein AAGB02_07635 [Pseudomonadota bacterium]
MGHGTSISLRLSAFAAVFAAAALAQDDAADEKVNNAPQSLGDVLTLQRTAQQATPAFRQPRIPREDLERLGRRIFELANPEEQPDEAGAPDRVVFTFDTFNGDDMGPVEAIGALYREDYGVTFGRGASVVICQPPNFTTSAAGTYSPCAYESAASGRNAALYDLRGGQQLRLDFDRPVSSISARINPTGGRLDEVFEYRITGFDANGARIAQNRQEFFWRQDAATWPTRASLSADGGEIVRATIELRRRLAASQSVRFLIDDLTLDFVPDGPSPVVADLNEETRPPRIGDPVVVQSPDDADLRDELRLYPPATRIRVGIDWLRANAALEEQNLRGIAPAALADSRAIDRVELPVLLPSRADGASLSVVGQRDSYHADFTRDGRDYAIYGTRVLTRIGRAPGAPAITQNLQIERMGYGMGASFSLYGASYTITRYCRNDSANEDPGCHDADDFGVMAEELALAIGAAGRRNP